MIIEAITAGGETDTVLVRATNISRECTGEGYKYIKVIKTRPWRICHAYWIQDIQISERCLAAEAVERLLTSADVC